MKIIFNTMMCGVLCSLSLGVGPTAAQVAGTRAVEQYLCKDVMREHGSNRDVAIAFLQGFLLGKSGKSAFDLELLHQQTSEFIEHCLDNPTERAVDAMSKIKATTASSGR